MQRSEQILPRISDLSDELMHYILTNAEYETYSINLTVQTNAHPPIYQSGEGIRRNSLCVEEPWRRRTHISRARGGGGGQFMVWRAVYLFGSTCSFPDRREQRAFRTSPCRVRLGRQLSVSLPTASGGSSGVVGVWALQQMLETLQVIT